MIFVFSFLFTILKQSSRIVLNWNFKQICVEVGNQNNIYSVIFFVISEENNALPFAAACVKIETTAGREGGKKQKEMCSNAHVVLYFSWSSVL